MTVDVTGKELPLAWLPMEDDFPIFHQERVVAAIEAGLDRVSDMFRQQTDGRPNHPDQLSIVGGFRWTSDPHFCDHPNEVPVVCPCPANCYCKSHTCRNRTGIYGATRKDDP